MGIWKEATFSNPNVYRFTDNGDGTAKIVPNFGTQTNDAKPLSPENLNQLEERAIQYCGVSFGSAYQYIITLTSTESVVDGTTYKFIPHVNNKMNANLSVNQLDGNTLNTKLICEGEQIGSDVLVAGIPVFVTFYGGNFHVLGVKNQKVGSIIHSACNIENDNYIICDGRSLDKNEYPELFETIGYNYGHDLQFEFSKNVEYSINDWATDGNVIVALWNKKMYQSEDGITFSRLTPTFNVSSVSLDRLTEVSDIMYINGKWYLEYITNKDTSTGTTKYKHILFSSDDCINWTEIQGFDNCKKIEDIIFNGTGYLLVYTEYKNSSTDYAHWYYSANGSVFNPLTTTEKDTSFHYKVIACGHEFLISVGNEVYKTNIANQKVFEEICLTANSDIEELFYQDNKYVATTDYDIYTSSDTITWNKAVFLGGSRNPISGDFVYEGKYRGLKSNVGIGKDPYFDVDGRPLYMFMQFKDKIIGVSSYHQSNIYQSTSTNLFHLPIVQDGYIKLK